MQSKYEVVTSQILESMSQGYLPWEVPWLGDNCFRLQKNHITNKLYKGINAWNLMLLSHKRGYLSNEWMTFNQASELQKKIRKGEKGSKVIYFKIIEKEAEEKAYEVDQLFFSKITGAFNLSQIEGFESEILDTHVANANQTGFEEIDLTKLNADISHQPISRAFYKRSTDRVYLPMKEQFKSEADYYGTVFHELIHRTGHESRLNRPALGSDEEYAFEELIAEFGAAYLTNYFGFKYTTQHASYIQSWHNQVSQKPYLLVKAISQAQKAADSIILELES